MSETDPINEEVTIEGLPQDDSVAETAEAVLPTQHEVDSLILELDEIDQALVAFDS